MKRHLPELDGLRGVAALSVALLHQQAFFGGADFFGHAYLAVDFFWMLSGFVLQHAYGHSLERPGHALQFLRERAVRLYPMLIIGAIAGLVATWLDKGLGLEIIATALINGLGLPVPWRGYPFWIDGPAWSLFFEILASVAFSLAQWRRRISHWPIIILLTTVLMIVANVHYKGLDFGFSWRTLAPGIVRVAPSFMIGVGLQYLHARGVLAEGGRRWWLAPVLIATFVALPLHSSWSAVYDPLVVLLIYPCIVLAAAGSSALIAPIASWSGKLSYPFYILHTPIIAIFDLVLIRAGYVPNKLLVVVSLVIAAFVAWFSFTWIDQPIRRRLHAVIGRGTHRATC